MAHNWNPDSDPCHALRVACCSALAMLLDLRSRLASDLLSRKQNGLKTSHIMLVYYYIIYHVFAKLQSTIVILKLQCDAFFAHCITELLFAFLWD